MCLKLVIIIIMSDYIQLWKPWTEIAPYTLGKTNKVLQGYSIAGLRTNFYIQPDLMLDAGLSAPFSPKYILITHGHGDHIANLPFHLYVKTPNADPIKIFCPKEIVQLINNWIVSMFQLSDANSNMIPHGYEIIGVDASTEPVEITCGNQPHLLEFFQCVHSVPCIGYGISQIKNKLKAEFVGLKSNEIKELKFKNVEITERVIEPQLFFSGDTTHELFELAQGKKILSFPNIIIECTFITTDDLSHAKEKQHMNWLNLKQYVQTNPQTNWILSHFSQKYKKDWVESVFAQENLSNVKLWCNIK
jgi:ribonuclease Z